MLFGDRDATRGVPIAIGCSRSAGRSGAELLLDGGEDLVGTDACRMVVDCGGDDQLVRLGLGDDRLEAFAHRVRGPDVRAARGSEA